MWAPTSTNINQGHRFSILCWKGAQSRERIKMYWMAEKNGWSNIALNPDFLLFSSAFSLDDEFDVAACGSQGQFVEEWGSFFWPASIPSRHSFLPCPVAVGPAASQRLWQEEEDDESGPRWRSPLFWRLSKSPGTFKLWELAAGPAFIVDPRLWFDISLKFSVNFWMEIHS